MKRFILFASLTVFVCLIGFSAAMGAVLLKTDGTAVGGYPDEEQSFVLITDTGEVSVKLKGVSWLAGQDPTRVRIKEGWKLLKGKLVEGEWLLKKKPTDKKASLPVKVSEVVFYSGDDIDLKKHGKMGLIEFGGSGLLTYLKLRKSKKEPFSVELYPECWAGELKLEKASYKQVMKSNEEFVIHADVRADQSAFESLNRDFPEDKKKSIGADLHIIFSDGYMSAGCGFDFALNKDESSDPPEYRQAAVFNFRKLFYQGGFGQIVGSMNFYLYLSTESESLADGKLIIINTLSNILFLPLTVEKTP